MKDKVLALARGDFEYESPEIVITPSKLVFSVAEGEKKERSFHVKNHRGTVIKGFGMTEELAIDFLPLFGASDNELVLTVDATALVAGRVLEGELILVTDCGETRLPYEIRVVSPSFYDGNYEVKDYLSLIEITHKDFAHGVELFGRKEFGENFLYKDDGGKLLYDHLKKRDDEFQSLEEFLVATGKKEPLRFELVHHDINEEGAIEYDLTVDDIRDSIKICLNTWGSMPIKVSVEGDFLEVNNTEYRSEKFSMQRDIIQYTIHADKVVGRKHGALIVESPYEKKVIKIVARRQPNEKALKVDRAKMAVISTLYRCYLACEEHRVTKKEYTSLLRKQKDVVEKISGERALPVKGYLGYILEDEFQILSFLQDIEKLDSPEAGASIVEVENYIMVKYIQFLCSHDATRKDDVLMLIDKYKKLGYQSDIIFYIQLKLDSRYSSLHIIKNDITEQLANGSNSPLLYSTLMRIYVDYPDLLTTLDGESIRALYYGAKSELITPELAVNVGYLAEKTNKFNPLLFAMLEKIYEAYPMDDLLKAICSLLIRTENRSKSVHKWFEMGVKKHLHLSEVYEYYMYTLDRKDAMKNGFELPEEVISYFQYENHLNEASKAFLYAYIIKMRKKNPLVFNDVFRSYQRNIEQFVVLELKNHRISEDLGVIYEAFLAGNAVSDAVAMDLPYVMFVQKIRCKVPNIKGVVVSHVETKEEKFYSLIDGEANVEIYSPNYQLFFVDDKSRYYAGTIDFEQKKLVHLDELAIDCFEQGSKYPQLVSYLATKARRNVSLKDSQIQAIKQAIILDLFRPRTKGKMLISLYENALKTKDNGLLLEVLDAVNPEEISRKKIGEIATQCIYQGLYEKGENLLLTYGISGCESKAIAMILQEKINELGGAFDPVLGKWAYYLYNTGYVDHTILGYLLSYHMGSTEVLKDVYDRCTKLPEIIIDDSCKERLLAQILFANIDPNEYEQLFLEYYESGTNRVLVKAIMSVLAYNYITGKGELSNEVFAKIEREAYYAKDNVMILATLKKYSKMSAYTKKQQEYIEQQLEACANENLIMSFMKDFVGKTIVPYEIDNAVLVQYYSGTKKGVFFYVKDEKGKYDTIQMKECFPGVFTTKLMMFTDEQKSGFVYEEESDNKTEEFHLKHIFKEGSSTGFFQMTNKMIVAKEKNDEFEFMRVQKKYENSRMAAGKLFTIH